LEKFELDSRKSEINAKNPKPIPKEFYNPFLKPD